MIARVSLTELPLGAMKRLPHPPFDVLVAHTARGVFAIEDACPHSGASLCRGELAGEIVTCPGHGWEIDVRSGRVLTAAGAGARATQLDVTVVDGVVEVRRGTTPETPETPEAPETTR